jgi:hypothetical protein
MSQHDNGPDAHGPNDGADPVQGSLDRATLDRLVRLAADGELSDEEATAYARALDARPELARHEDAERNLRTAVGRCMCTGCECPQAVRDRILGLTESIRSGQPQLGFNPTPAEQPSQPAARFRLWPRVGVLAAAVVIVIAVSAYFRSNEPTQGGGPGVAMADDLPSGVQLAGFMTNEHSRCASHPTSIRKFTERDLEHVPEAFQDVLGGEFKTERLLMEGATFVAGGKCSVPGKGPSVHLMFAALSPQGEPVEVSVYIQRCGDKRFEEGKAYAVGADTQEAASIIGWRHDGLVYYLVTSSPETTRTLADKLKAPALAGAI